MSVYSKRINKLRKTLETSQAALIKNNNNVYYFSGMQNSEGYVIVTNDDAYLLVDFRYAESARNICKSCKVIEFNSLFESLKSVLKDNSIKSLLIESDSVNINLYQRFIKEFNSIGVSVISDDTLVKAIQNLRIIKSDDEIEFISEAQRITEKAYTEVLNYVKPGVNERTVAVELEYLMRKFGAEGVSFDLITITGKNTSLPHGVPGENVISEGDFFTMDIGALYNGYHSDMTRTVAVKSCDDYQREIYDIVFKAQTTALNNVRAGVKASEIDKTARDIITEAGYGKNFGHSTGHGVGLDIHENPFVSSRGETILSENMVITVEPGIYLENRFGVRIEDMVLVKENGFFNFATLTKELIIV
ncbi:MAG: aminopeptidase P family protein [Ruminococcus sp.]|nr:aminopeptidase P family protein [Ruminococcus sp.]